ncbi:MAG: type II secretion system protein [Solirubrobacteraceae bacterium]
MLYRLRQRSKDEGGFTLIELLVVILIIGILAAIAIPSFLNQKSKANDAAAKSQVRTGETAMETYSTDHNGEYLNSSKTAATTTEIQAVEPTLNETSSATFAVTAASATGYTITSTSKATGDVFTITRGSNGEVTRTCSSSTTGCSGAKSGSW